MRKKNKRQPRYRLLKAGCLSAGLLSISNPTQVTAADIGVLNVQTGTLLKSLPNPFPNSQLGVHVATGDLDGDGRADIVAGPGKGDDGVALAESISLNFTKIEWDYQPQRGIRVAAGDVDGDGHADIITTPSYGRGSHTHYLKIKGSSVATTTELDLINEFDTVFDGFSGGVSIAAGDLDDDALTPDDVLAGRLSCACGRPIRKWPTILTSGKVGFGDYGDPAPHGEGGVQVATGDLDGDGVDDVLIMPNDPLTGLTTPLIMRSGAKQKKWLALESFDEPAGVNIALGDIDNDGISEIVVGSGKGTGPHIKIVKVQWNSLTSSFTAEHDHWAPFAFPDYPEAGLRVAVGDVNGDDFGDIVFAQAAVPEPATLMSLLTGLGAWLIGGRRRRRD